MHNTTRKITFAGMMAAIICVITLLRIPLLGSKVHFANAMCLLSGLLLGPVCGGVAAGLGSMIYDLLLGGYEISEALITFVSKFAMAFICAIIAGRVGKRNVIRVIIGSIVGALSYVALYMLKTWCMHLFVYREAMETVLSTMVSKLPASMLNAAAAMIAAPIIYKALEIPLKRYGIPWYDLPW